jgi:Na+-transporting methylmalonyl-CoA/oxaloacetate decarboxylase gamma subunit
MDSIHFLNLEYFILLIYGFFTGASTSVDPSQLSIQTLEFVTRLAWTGLTIAFLFFIGLLYAITRMREVQKEGWSKREKEDEKRHRQKAAVAPKSPQWERVIMMANSGVESDWRRAILEADIMLGTILQIRGYRGATIGDMLKEANPIQFTTLDLAWKAHKVRNDIAHGGESFVLTGRETSATIDMYRRVFEEFDYI